MMQRLIDAQGTNARRIRAAANAPSRLYRARSILAILFSVLFLFCALPVYSAEDWNAIKRFLALVDDQGETNGYKVAGASYSPDMLQSLPG